MIVPDNAKVSDLDDDIEGWEDVHAQVDAWVAKYVDGQEDDGTID